MYTAFVVLLVANLATATAREAVQGKLILLIRVPLLSYALMGGAISPRIFWLVQFRLVSENWTGALEWLKQPFIDIWQLSRKWLFTQSLH